MNERDEIEAGFEELIAEGKMEVVGHDENGERLFQLTQEGRLHVENLLDEVLERAAQAFSEKLEIPLYMARDMIVHHASQMKEADSGA